MLFGYLHAVGAGGQAWLLKPSMNKTFSSIQVYYWAHYGWARRRIFKIKVLSSLENTILRLVFASTVFHKSAILLIFYKNIGIVLDILSHPDST